MAETIPFIESKENRAWLPMTGNHRSFSVHRRFHQRRQFRLGFAQLNFVHSDLRKNHSGQSRPLWRTEQRFWVTPAADPTYGIKIPGENDSYAAWAATTSRRPRTFSAASMCPICE